jgi:hypothetical protein
VNYKVYKPNVEARMSVTGAAAATFLHEATDEPRREHLIFDLMFAYFVPEGDTETGTHAKAPDGGEVLDLYLTPLVLDAIVKQQVIEYLF